MSRSSDDLFPRAMLRAGTQLGPPTVSGEFPVPLEPVDLVFAVTVVVNQTSGFERIHQLLGLEVGAAEEGRHGGAKLTLSFDIPGWPDDPKKFGQSVAELGKIDFFRNHAPYLRRDVALGNVLRHRLGR